MPTTYAIPDGRKHFDVQLSTPVAGGMTFSGMLFKPDFLWRKARNNAESHYVADSNRGTTVFLSPNLTTAELGYQGSDGSLTFNADGYTITDSNYNSGEFYFNGRIYVDWLWKAGGTAVSNNAGSITSQVSANPTAGFSVVTWTGTNANATIGHGLGVAPAMYITKQRSATGNWFVYHQSIGATKGLFLDLTNAATTNIYFNNTAPTSTVFSIGSSVGGLNASGVTQVTYCFAPVAGYSAFGSFVGGGATADNTFIYLGFRPRYFMFKRTGSAGDWVILDSSRSPYNQGAAYLYANASNAEATNAYQFDFLSNGVKFRDSAGNIASGGTYIYMAFAENPFKYSSAR